MKNSESTINTKTISIGVMGIELLVNTTDLKAASINSQLLHELGHENKNVVDAIETMILSQYTAGFDVTAPSYIEALKSAVEGLGNHLDEGSDQENIMNDCDCGIEDDGDDEIVHTVTRERRVDAIANESIEMTVTDANYQRALEAVKLARQCDDVETEDEELTEALYYYIRDNNLYSDREVIAEIQEINKTFQETFY